jgi:hypothetical protein
VPCFWSHRVASAVPTYLAEMSINGGNSDTFVFGRK